MEHILEFVCCKLDPRLFVSFQRATAHLVSMHEEMVSGDLEEGVPRSKEERSTKLFDNQV